MQNTSFTEMTLVLRRQCQIFYNQISVWFLVLSLPKPKNIIAKFQEAL